MDRRQFSSFIRRFKGQCRLPQPGGVSSESASGETVDEMSSAIHWRAPLCVSKRAELDTIATNIELELPSTGVYQQKQVLIDAIETWLQSFREVSCGNLKCSCSSTA